MTEIEFTLVIDIIGKNRNHQLSQDYIEVHKLFREAIASCDTLYQTR